MLFSKRDVGFPTEPTGTCWVAAVLLASKCLPDSVCVANWDLPCPWPAVWTPKPGDSQAEGFLKREIGANYYLMKRPKANSGKKRGDSGIWGL